MSSHPHASIDLKPAAPSRPTLALVLALLAVPGTTLAWDLPFGGLWIGLPLALAAIVLGVRARRQGANRGRSTTAVIVAGLCIAQMVVFTIVSVVDGSSSESTAKPVAPSSSQPGVRYDGGPEEGRAFSGDRPGVRYDGGPEEGRPTASIPGR
jgi:hypothetical protein